jgi:phosphatidylglycerol:prolipoprotein diacylglycerol transferase
VIPYFTQPKLHLGPLTIHAFGVLVATGILLAIHLIRHRAVRVGLDPALSERLAMRIVIVSFLCAHVFDRLAYFPRETWADPLSLLRIWESISSFGGFIGATLTAVLFLRSRRKQKDGWRYLDIISYAFPVGWLFGRLGCTLAFDHPGSETTFFLAQRYSDNIIRHNLGLDEALYVLPIVITFLLLGRKLNRPEGFYLALLPILYAPGRFFLDFLRHDDARYFGLTPAHYGSILLLIVGVWLFRRVNLAAAHKK